MPESSHNISSHTLWGYFWHLFSREITFVYFQKMLMLWLQELDEPDLKNKLISCVRQMKLIRWCGERYPLIEQKPELISSSGRYTLLFELSCLPNKPYNELLHLHLRCCCCLITELCEWQHKFIRLCQVFIRLCQV